MIQVEWHRLDNDVWDQVLARLSLPDKAAFSMSCTFGRDAWRRWPFSAQEYGSRVPHRPTSRPPSRQDWVELLRQKSTMVHGVDSPVAWLRVFRERAGVPPRQSIRDLEGHGNVAWSGPESVEALVSLSMDFDDPMCKRSGFREDDRAYWKLYQSLLVGQGRVEEADEIGEKDRRARRLTEAIAKHNYAAAAQAIAAGDYLDLTGQSVSGSWARSFSGDLEVATWLIHCLAGQGKSRELNTLAARLCPADGALRREILGSLCGQAKKIRLRDDILDSWVLQSFDCAPRPCLYLPALLSYYGHDAAAAGTLVNACLAGSAGPADAATGSSLPVDTTSRHLQTKRWDFLGFMVQYGYVPGDRLAGCTMAPSPLRAKDVWRHGS